MDLVNDSERLARRSATALLASNECDRQTGLEGSTLDKSKLMVRLLEEAFDWMDTDQERLTVGRVVLEPVMEALVNRSERRKMMENALS